MLLIRLAVTAMVVLAALQSAAQSTPGFGTYSYDGAGNITAAGGDRFVYDELGRIRSATLSGGHTQELTYDRYGNIRQIVTSGDPYPAVPAVNEATNRIDLSISTTNMVGQYDAAGNLITYNGTDRFTYDALNVMTESTVGGQRRLYLYTASNERIAIVNMAGSTATSSTWTLRDASAKVLRKLERDAAGTWRWQEDYIYRGSQMLAAEVPGNTLHFHLDHLGTPRVITGNGGARISVHTYYPFGRELTSAAQDAETKKFTGHERDAVNLDYMHARSYLPWTGRFLSVDPVLDVKRSTREPQSWNRYSYVINNPINRIDPDGRMDGNGLGEPAEWRCPGCSRAEQLEQSNQIAAGTAIGGAATLAAIFGGPPAWRAIGQFAAIASFQLRTTLSGATSIMLGQTMVRVKSAAGQTGSLTFEATGAARTTQAMWTQNQAFLQNAISKGHRIFDIGPNPALKNPGYFHPKEVEFLTKQGYQRVHAGLMMVQGQAVRVFEWVKKTEQ